MGRDRGQAGENPEQWLEEAKQQGKHKAARASRQ